MKIRHLASISFAALLFAVSALGGEQPLLRVTSDAVSGNVDISLILDQNSTITGFKYVSPLETQTFDIQGLSSGIVLLNDQGFDVVKLLAKDFDPRGGGAVGMVYLNNGLTGTYRTYPLELEREGQTWKLRVNDASGRREINRMFLKAKKFFGRIIGIDQIIPG